MSERSRRSAGSLERGNRCDGLGGSAQGRTWDFYVIDYPAGVALHEHTDPVDGRRHFRVNVRLRGDDTYVGESLWRTPRIVVFRPDIMPHGAGASKTRRVLLSFGCAR